MRKPRATVYTIWTNHSRDYAGITCAHSDSLSLAEANNLALRLNKDAVQGNLNYRFFVLEDL